MASENRKIKRCGNGEGSIFQRADGRWAATISIGFDAGSGKRQRTLRNAGLTYRSFHNLRHTYATLALAAGVPVNIVSALLGHAKPSSAQPQCSASMPNRLFVSWRVRPWYANPPFVKTDPQSQFRDRQLPRRAQSGRNLQFDPILTNERASAFRLNGQSGGENPVNSSVSFKSSL